MIIIIGLGNPGKKFENTRHNVGFMAIDEFAKKNNFPDFVLNKKANALISENNKIILAKPQTFMNESGKAVRVLTKPYILNPKPLLVIVHDDIDLKVGKIKIVKERGSAGHKGVESIIKNIGNEGLIRIRIGIGGQNDVKAMKVVLKKFSKNEQKIINGVIFKTTDAIDSLIKNGHEKATNEFN
ncbi:MAG: aminoacyl-tRNA hydrolase [Candidatus Staskawiczbacteria bacterium RIFOXYD1_FULL_39_28]|uniref:Peptidyl-tRNA hydrolase n=1 Tax=Candidatus Staskawiczbacteria bacterium RIFOXYC1_FULL_38_18 TaxID=1802229 RepID=A0A1G2JC21_9BACT|nr:MAG: aminoacyl-tRNA hydrolase [Candidatus Staskawiczbacteria bacterium RIFOXYC1_FULL_38_18]OGZ91437.1 MAG: aminoacyl-tRNA hydrolase [Candidatus Staskawiczbacteria bacterium RIFOXYD1_FULL_39_28]